MATTDKTLTKGGEFLIKETLAQDIFIPEEWTEEQKMIAQTCVDFLEAEVNPNLDRIDSQEEGLMESLMNKAGELGLLGVSVPEVYGGFGKDFNSSMLVTEKVGAGHSFAVALSAHTGIGTLPILYYGNEEQKAKYIPKLASGEWKAAYCLTEPNAGSDANSGKTKAKLSEDGKHYIINGQKMWITNAGFADVFTVFAKIDDDENLSAFIIEKSFGGITMNPEEHKMGIKGSSTRQVFFNDCKVPVENLLSERQNGFKIAVNILNIGRIKLCASAIGACKEVTSKAINYSNERIQFNIPISKYGAIRYKLAEMATKIWCTEAAAYRAGQNIDDAYDALVADQRYNKTKYGAPSLSSQLGGITWNGQGVAFCGDSCGFNTDYLVWNKSVEKIATAAFSEALLTPFQQRYANVPNEFRAMSYESNITILGDGYPDVNGHGSYHDNLFGDSANIHLYGRQNPGSNVWCIDPLDDTKHKRITSGETQFAWWNPAAADGPWNAFLISVQGVRSVKRGLKSRGLTNTSIDAWIAPKDWGGVSNGSGLVGFVNTQYYDEMVRHASLTGVEVFGFFNGLEFTTPTPVDTARRRVQFGVTNAILVDINRELGGYTPTTLDDSRVSYNCLYVMSGAPTATGTYLWRVTPKVSTHKIFSNGVLVPKTSSEIGVWITTITSTKPSITVSP